MKTLGQIELREPFCRMKVIKELVNGRYRKPILDSNNVKGLVINVDTPCLGILANKEDQ